jgi:hypothetical protein
MKPGGCFQGKREDGSGRGLWYLLVKAEKLFPLRMEPLSGHQVLSWSARKVICR